MQIDYKINLEVFEGPLDLLLHLIKKNDLTIYDIPISKILSQYVQYLELMKELDIDIAGEFIYMASELSLIKSKLLLYKDEALEPDEPDPRADLMARLMEYQKYKNAASHLAARPLLGRDVFNKEREPVPETLILENLDRLQIEPFSLLKIFNDILKKAPKEAIHEVQVERVSLTEKIYAIIDHLKKEDSVEFARLFEGTTDKIQLVVTFLAILEMARMHMISVYQMDRMGPIHLKKKMSFDTDFSETLEGLE